MTLVISVQEYIEQLTGFENQPISMEIMLRPFNLLFPSLEEPTLLTGLMIDSLYLEYTADDLIDPYDIAFIASDLGYDEAYRFIQAIPASLAQIIRPTKRRRGASQD